MLNSFKIMKHYKIDLYLKLITIILYSFDMFLSIKIKKELLVFFILIKLKSKKKNTKHITILKTKFIYSPWFNLYTKLKNLQHNYLLELITYLNI